MYKLLVNTPNNTQEIVEVTETGSYFELERVIWDERADGPLPEVTLGGMVRLIDEEGVASLIFDQSILDAQPKPVVAVPYSVTMRQARLALLQAGHLANVKAALDAMQGVEGEAARIEWEYATELQRDHVLINSLAGALALSSEDVDQLFILAATL